MAFPGMSQTVVDLSTGRTLSANKSSEPKKSIVNNNLTTQVTYAIDNILLEADPDFEDEYLFSIEGFGRNNIPGEPATLTRNDCIHVPHGYTAYLSVTDCRYKELPYKLGPSRVEPADVDTAYKYDNTTVAVRPFSGTFPSAFVSMGDKEYYRGECIQYINISPILYDYRNECVRILTNLTYSVTLQKGQALSAPKSTLKIFDDDFLSSMVMNPQSAQQKATDKTTEKSIKDYLIITTPKYEEEVNRFARWKKITGFNTYVISHASWTIEEVKSEIISFADEHPNLYYLLLVGDYEDIPATIDPNVWKDDTFVSDYPYGSLDGDDLADIYLGRVSVSSKEEAKNVFDKIISYTKNPPSVNSFYGNAAHGAYYQTSTRVDKEARAFIQTSETIRNMMVSRGKSIERIYYTPSSNNPQLFNNGKPLPAEITRDFFEWAGNSEDISKAINDGIFYIFHRDHGAATYWDVPRFSIYDMDNLTNSKLLPVVFSINCNTGRFDVNCCFSEKFLRKYDSGCVAIFGAGGLSPTWHNDALSIGMFTFINESLNEQNKPVRPIQLGEILSKGMAHMIATHGLNNTSEYERKIYHVFGDPSMEFYISLPDSIQNVNIERGSTISVSSDSQTEIIIYNETKDKIEIFNSNTFSLANPELDNVTICIRGTGLRPIIIADTDPSTITIQDEFINSSRSYTANKINVGNAIDKDMPKGNVIFNSGTISLNGEIFMDCGTEVKKGVIFNAKKVLDN